MKSKSISLVILFAVFLLTASCGCSKKDDQSQETAAPEADSSHLESPEGTPTQANGNNATPALAEDTSLNEVVALWDAGQQEEATTRFLSIDWQKADALRDSPGLTMSEAQILALAEGQRQPLLEETMNQLGSMRKLFFHIASEAERLAGEGSRAQAEKYLEAVRQYGTSLSGADHLEMVQMHGKAATVYAEKKLSELK
jgi:hypothetical protein